MKFKKKILDPNTYTVNGVDVNLETSNFRRWVRNFKKLKDKGFNLPAPFYHDDKAVPVKLTPDKKDVDAYNNGGFWDRLWVSKKGALWGEVDVPDPEKAKKIEIGEIKEVSPAVRDIFEVGPGEALKDVVTHIALVTQPVAGAQEPFESVAAARCFARSMAKDPPDSGSWDFQQITAPTVNASNAELQDVLKVLDEMGLSLPDDTTEANFYERVVTAALAVGSGGKGRMKQQDMPPHQSLMYSRDSDKEADMPDDQKTDETVEATPAPDLEMAKKMDAVTKFAEKTATESLMRRVTSLKLPDDFKEKHLKPLIDSHVLNFSQDGAIVPGTLDVVLDVLEDLPQPEAPNGRSHFLSRMVPEKGQVEDLPADPKETPASPEDADTLIDSLPTLKSRLVG